MGTSRTESILANAERLRALNQAIHDAFATREQSDAAWDRWRQAAAAFRDNYGKLFYPGGVPMFDALTGCEVGGNRETVERPAGRRMVAR